MRTGDNRSDSLPEEEMVLTSMDPSMLADIADFAWYRYLDRTEAIRCLVKQGLATQDAIETAYGDRRQLADEVVVD